VDWETIWPIVWPILREALVAALVAILALLGYDQVLPSRYVRGELKKKRIKDR
jgi:hypothetical protein